MDQDLLAEPHENAERRMIAFLRILPSQTVLSNPLGAYVRAQTHALKGLPVVLTLSQSTPQSQAGSLQVRVYRRE